MKVFCVFMMPIVIFVSLMFVWLVNIFHLHVTEQLMMFVVAIMSAIGLILWAWMFLHYLANKKSMVLSTYWFPALLFANWVAAILYVYFVYLPIERNQRKNRV